MATPSAEIHEKVKAAEPTLKAWQLGRESHGAAVNPYPAGSAEADAWQSGAAERDSTPGRQDVEPAAANRATACTCTITRWARQESPTCPAHGHHYPEVMAVNARCTVALLARALEGDEDTPGLTLSYDEHHGALLLLAEVDRALGIAVDALASSASRSGEGA